MLRLLFVIKGSALNRGMNTGIENLAWGLAERDYDVHILSGGTIPDRHEYNFPDGVVYHFTGNLGAPGDHLEEYLKLHELYNFDVVIGWIKNLSPLAISKKIAKDMPKFIANEGQTTSLFSQLIFIRYLLVIYHALKNREFSFNIFLYRCRSAQNLGNSMDSVVAISEAVGKCAKNIYGIDKKRIRIIPRGIDTDLFHTGNVNRNFFLKQRPRLIFTGNIAKEKGLGDIADALFYLETPVDWVICGKDQGYLSTIQRRLQKSKTKHQLIYLGPLPQEKLVLELLSSDIFIFSSWGEGLGKSLLEAMSCGLPVIVSNIMAFSGVVQNGHNGTVAKVKSPASIANAISLYLERGDLRAMHGYNARKTIETNFSKETELESWVSIIQNTTHSPLIIQDEI